MNVHISTLNLTMPGNNMIIWVRSKLNECQREIVSWVIIIIIICLARLGMKWKDFGIAGLTWSEKKNSQDFFFLLWRFLSLTRSTSLHPSKKGQKKN